MAEPVQILTPPRPVRVAGPPADIIELVMADHRRIRRLSAALEDMARWGNDSVWMLSHSWLRLASLLEVHTRAEEEICYLPATRGHPDRTGHLRVAVADHGDLREAIAEASLCQPGSASWWRAVRVILDSHAGHFDREERGLLAGGVAGLSACHRRELGRQWCAFVAAWRNDAALPG